MSVGDFGKNQLLELKNYNNYYTFRQIYDKISSINKKIIVNDGIAVYHYSDKILASEKF